MDSKPYRIYGVEIKALKQAVKRNIGRFPEEPELQSSFCYLSSFHSVGKMHSPRIVDSLTINLTLLTRQRNLPDLFSRSFFLCHAQLERVSGYEVRDTGYKEGLFAINNAQHVTRNPYHRGQGAHKDNQIIK